MKEKRQKFVEGRVSAVTPVYNGAKYLPAMLDSVLAQAYDDMEMILVDDGSEDDTVRIAESYRPKFLERGYGYRIVRAEHRNASAALNEGLPYVTGEYLIWPDSDDVLRPESVEKRVDFLRRHPEYKCVRSLAYYFDAETGEKREADEKTGDLTGEELFWEILEMRTFVCCGCYMLKSEAFFAIYPGRHIPEYEVGQNFQMLLPFMFRHKCPTIREELYGVCVRQNSHSRRVLTREEEKKKYRDYEDLVDEIAAICGIEDGASRERIARWKIRRRYGLAIKYGDRRQIRRAVYQRNRLEKRSFFYIVKDVLWYSLEDTWVVKKVYPLWLRCTRRG